MNSKKLCAAAFSSIALMLTSFVMAPSHAQYRGRAGSSSGVRARSGLPLSGRTARPRATVIPNRSGGFDMYSPRGNSRYLGESQGNKVFDPNGSSSVVIPDNAGGATVYGPQGTHRVFPEESPYTDE